MEQAVDALPQEPGTRRRPRRSTLPFPVVGLGASAGGLSAAMAALAPLPPEPNMAFVLVMHLSAEHESHAATILQRSTALPVVQVTRTVPIEVNRVYVIAPGLHLAMDDGHLVVESREQLRGRPVAIDLFFRTLAQAHRERAIAVVLSGSGSDGTLGLAHVKAEGGISIAQAPGDAEHDGMPASAIASGRVDFVLPAAEVAHKLLELWHNARHIRLPGARDSDVRALPTRSQEEDERARAALDEVLAIVASRTGNDFARYKRGTLLRRLERRMQVTRQPSLPAYRDYLDAHPQETEHVLQDMLISVTSFFRDRDAFEALERELVRSVFEHRPHPPRLRAWSAGCASGEEAYSLAMLLNDHMPAAARIDVQVFGSDIDDRALTVARHGSYPQAIAENVPPTRLRQYFEKTDGHYRVRKALREQVLFARHNVLRDPPFSRLDIVSCRNLLIYLDREAQAQVLQTFHFALNPGGLLLLGTAESVEPQSQLFSVVDKRYRVYRANAVHARDAQVRPLPAFAAGAAVLRRQIDDPREFASVLIDANGRILHSGGGAARYLRHVEGQPSQDLLEAAIPELASALRPALILAARSGQRVAARPVTLDGEQGRITVQMTVKGRLPGEGSHHMLVMFDELDASLAATDGHDPAVPVLEAEIRRLRRQLEGSLDETETSGHALRASNEELQSINEELRSSTEELETSKEELQSVNEELTTVNFELKHKVEETAKINDDLSNLIASMNIATVFVDRQLRIKGFTPLATQVFNVQGNDIGRPLTDLTHRLRYDQVAEDVNKVLETLQPLEHELAAGGERWYLLRVSPYRTNEDRIDGAVLNFIDVTDRRNAQQQLRARDERLRLVAESTKDYAVVTLDPAGVITGWNKGAELMFRYSEQEAVGEHFRLLFVPEDRANNVAEKELLKAAEHGRAEDERWHLRKDGSRFYASGITTPLLESGEHGFAKIARDLTDRQQLERQRDELLKAEQQVRQQLEAAHALRGEFLAVMSHELKNPLNLVLLNAELIARTPAVTADARMVRAIDTIRRSVQGQAQIIDDLLDLSRLDTGKLTLHRSAVQWKAVVERIVGAVRAEAEAKGLSIGLAAEDEVVFADVVRVEQITWNLVSNALKFTPPGGSIDVRLAAEDECAVLVVSDTGQGIEPALLPRIFEMFVQADAPAVKRRSGGLGIGLALVKNLAELHGGSVQAHSDGLGQGSAFSVRLPRFRGAAAAAGAPQDRGTSAVSGWRVLLVDDDLDTLESFGDVLTLEGATVTRAVNGKHALEIAQHEAFDLVLSDIGMPELDGLSLVARLRELATLRAKPLIAVSGFGRDEDAARSREAGFDAHLSKPLSMEKLEAVLQTLRRRDA